MVLALNSVQDLNHILKPNAIVVCCTPSWLPYAAVTLLSCFQHGACEVADLYVAVIGASSEDHKDFANFTKTYGFAAKLIPANLPMALATFTPPRFGPAALLRLNLEEILPPEYRRVLYLDSDILAQSSVADIFAVDLKGKIVGAVEDYQSLPGPMKLFSSYSQNLGLARNARYFNSGVLLFDWQQIREGGHLRRCIERYVDFQQGGHSLKLPDQDLLNLEFAGNWKRLDMRFNLMSFFVDYFPAIPVFRHFSNRVKPWGSSWQPGLASARNIYREVLRRSPWADFAPGHFTRPSIAGTCGVILRMLDPFSGRRYRKYLEKS